MSGRTMQHDFTLETEAAFLQHPAGGGIDGTDKPDNPLRLEITAGEGQGLRHQFRRIAISPAIRMQMIGKVESFEFP